MSESNEKENISSDKNQAQKFLNDIYDDFFYLFSSTPEKLDELKNKLETLEGSKSAIPNVVEKHEDTKKEEQPEKQVSTNNTEKELKKIYSRIENSHLTPDSKLVLKKMISYAQKFSSGVTKKYIPFNMRIYCDNDETLYSIVNIITDGFKLFNYIQNKEAVERSFFIIEESRHISDLYNSQNSIVIFKDADGLLNKDKNSRDKLLNVWENEIIDYSNFYGITTIITDTSKDKIDEALSNNTALKDKVFDFELFTDKADNQEVYNSILNQLKKDYIITGDFELKLLDYVTETYSKTTLSAPEYISAVIEKILFNQTEDTIIKAEYLPPFEKDKSITEIFKDLNSLIGLDNIKVMLKDLVNLNKFKEKTTEDLNLKETNLHMVFLGNPGTGKTTVARIVAGILYNLGFIKQNKLIEVSSKDLIGQYVGQTAPKTLGVIEKALGGVLFIDEAYSLASTANNNSSFNEECIATLIQAMENNRDNLVVIFAGYSKEMDAFLKSNSGIVSRIGYTMEFKDYTLDELITILISMFEKAGFIIDESAIEKAKEIITKYMGTQTFGNARFARNLYEKAVIKHASNTENQTDRTILKTITADDITDENLGKLD